MNPCRVLLVEDDDSVATAISAALQLNGFSVERVSTAADGFDSVHLRNPDLILLDRRLPDGDGMDLIRSVRKVVDVPVILVTARGDQSMRVAGLEAGADDYVVKPFGMQELLARVRAVLRRARRESDGSTSTGGGYLLYPVDTGDVRRSPATLHPASRQLRPSSIVGAADGEVENLTVKELDLILTLIRAGNRVVTRETLAEQVWGAGWVADSRTLDVHVAGVRNKLGDRTMIQTVRGVGYRLTARVEDA